MLIDTKNTQNDFLTSENNSTTSAFIQNFDLQKHSWFDFLWGFTLWDSKLWWGTGLHLFKRTLWKSRAESSSLDTTLALGAACRDGSWKESWVIWGSRWQLLKFLLVSEEGVGGRRDGSSEPAVTPDHQWKLTVYTSEENEDHNPSRLLCQKHHCSSEYVGIK